MPDGREFHTVWAATLKPREAKVVSVSHSVICSVCLSATSELNISETRPDSRMVPMDSLYKLAHGLLTAHAPDDVT